MDLHLHLFTGLVVLLSVCTSETPDLYVHLDPPHLQHLVSLFSSASASVHWLGCFVECLYK